MHLNCGRSSTLKEYGFLEIVLKLVTPVRHSDEGSHFVNLFLKVAVNHFAVSRLLPETTEKYNLVSLLSRCKLYPALYF